MPKPLPHVRSGDDVEPYLFNECFAELERLRKLVVVGALSVDMDGPDPRIVLPSPFRPILVSLPSAGINARNASTGVWGSAQVQVYRDDIDSGGNPKSVLVTTPATEIAYNKGNKPVGGSGVKDAWAYRDERNRLIVFGGVYC